MFWLIVVVFVLGFIIKSLIQKSFNYKGLPETLYFLAAFAFFYYAGGLDLAIGISIFFAVIAFLVLVSGGISSLSRKFYDLKTILNFLAIKLFTVGITDGQKINKIKKINELALYGKKNQDLAKEKKEKEKRQAELKMFDKKLVECTESYNKIVNIIEKEMEEYINSGYIDLVFIKPTRKYIVGYIAINTKINKSIMTIVSYPQYDDTYKAYEIETKQELIPTHNSKVFSSNNYKVTISKAKKYLLKYFELHPEELEK